MLTMVPSHGGCHNSGMDSGKLQGGHADPFGLHEGRYFSAGHPTKLVRDGGTECYDEPPPESWQAGASAGLSETASDLEDMLAEPPEAERDVDYAPPPKR